MFVLYNVVQLDQSMQEYKSFDIYAVTIKISMTEYHNLINLSCYYQDIYDWLPSLDKP